MIMVHPLPRIMHPVYNQGRRRARAKVFLSQLNSRRENALFVDASRSGPNSFLAAVVDMSGRTVSAASVRTRSIGVAEQVAISLALTTKDPYPIFSDSMTAVRSFDANQTSLAARTFSPGELGLFGGEWKLPVEARADSSGQERCTWSKSVKGPAYGVRQPKRIPVA
ncbi:hypothetical protein HPB50_011882 [Hyalomma asiaticum]|uniref:Uncharacterized protein n=1 Tax=Hyalomma asiaticum TaxID=266040 RepID=A0ACB7RTT1_HYAAI|nr:hypothetical protein HPB50_011882 [Hyalomma asiaticum]